MILAASKYLRCKSPPPETEEIKLRDNNNGSIRPGYSSLVRLDVITLCGDSALAQCFFFDTYYDN